MGIERTPATLLIAVCTFVLCGILTAGLWPFNAPRNEVSWLSHANGLHFRKYSSILSAGPFNPQLADSACSLEIWLKPKRIRSSGTILAFYQPESHATSFSLRQSLGDLVLQRAGQNVSGQAKKVKVYIEDILSHQKAVLVTISAGQSGTTVYSDGALVKRLPNFKLSSQYLTGQLIVGNSPVTTDNWSGQLKGLALYNRELTADEVSQHFLNWTNGSQPNLAKSVSAVALYLFNEGNGNTIANHADSATDLLIPERFFVLHPQFLERPWDEFRWDWNYWKNVGINVAGFIPLGFFFYAYFSRLRRAEHSATITIALGFSVSLTIEVLQALLPTRDSGMTDLITNTLGTAVGVMAFRRRAVKAK
ncbi:MAG: uncharacterized protein JWQ87_186 [Candidatus Sulfotelmatobacter sp.]|nr:uncharacterized protein [Candidatus Sulfotelmatobacter sp.]